MAKLIDAYCNRNPTFLSNFLHVKKLKQKGRRKN